MLTATKAISVGTLVSTMWISSAVAQGTFEGMVTYRMSSAQGKAIVMRMYQLGSKLRQEYDTPQGTVATITDGTTGDMTSIMPQQKKYLVINLRDAAKAMAPMAQAFGGGKRPTADEFAKFKVTATGKRETIAGVACEHYLMAGSDRQGAEMDICGASGMGFMGMGQQGGTALLSTDAMVKGNPALASLAKKGFFPLKMTMTDHGKTSVFEATALDRRRPSAALFAPPPGYTKLEMPMMPR